MIRAADDNGLIRIGVFYDGNYFARVSAYYLYQHERRARLSITGLHNFIREEIAKKSGVDKTICQVVDSHYFRARYTAKQALEKDLLYGERQWDDVLIREGVTMHFLPLRASPDKAEGSERKFREKGIDVWFALEAFELAIHKRFDVSVLVAGDGDFVPLVRKLNTLGTRVMLLAWDFAYEWDGRHHETRASQDLINEVTYPILMSDEVDSRTRKRDQAINTLFMPRTKESEAETAGGGSATGADPESGKLGTIVTLNPEKGFGFIRPAGGGDNLFFHTSSLVDCSFEDLKPGLQVKFQQIMGERGLVAINVQRL